MALVQMENELQCSSAVSQLSGKSVDAAGNIATYTAEGADSGRVSAPLVVEPARREVMTTAEKDERSERTRARQAACAAAAQRLADAAVQARHKELRAQAHTLRATVPEHERDLLITRHKFARALAAFGPGPRDQCPACWLYRYQCVCAPPPPPAVRAAFPHRTLIYLHVKEYGRQSNTGALAAVAFPPPQSAVFVAGIPEHEEVNPHTPSPPTHAHQLTRSTPLLDVSAISPVK